MPFVWSTIASKGQIFGDPSTGSSVAADQRAVVLVSRLQRDVLRRRRSAGRQQRQGAQPERHRARVAERPAGLRGTRRGVRLVGRAALHPQRRPQRASRSAADSRRCRRPRPIASARSTSSPTICRAYWDYGPFDAPIVYAALDALRTSKPRVLYIMLGEGDEWAHEGRYDLYLDATFRADRFIQRDLGHAAVAAGVPRTDDAARDDRSRPRRDDQRLDRSRQGVPAAERTWIALIGRACRRSAFAQCQGDHLADRRDDRPPGRRGLPVAVPGAAAPLPLGNR